MTLSQYIESIPVWYAKIGAAIIFFSVLVMVWALPKNFIYRGSPDTRRWRDLRLWATILIIVQLILYLLF